MLESFRRPVSVALFLLGLLGFHSLWVLAGGQSHVDLIFWPWKLGLAVAGAGMIAVIGTGSGSRVRIAAILLVVTVALAGFLAYQAHLNEPVDEDGENSEQLTRG